MKAEIKRLKKLKGYLPIGKGELYEAYQARGYQCACDELLSFIESLEKSLSVEEPELDFEEEWDRFEDWAESYNQSDYPTCYEPKQIARYFFELGKNARKVCALGK